MGREVVKDSETTALLLKFEIRHGLLPHDVMLARYVPSPFVFPTVV